MTSTLHDPTAPALDPLPSGAHAWRQRAREVADALQPTSVERDVPGREPHEEVALLKQSGLPALLAPRDHGGGGGTSRPRCRSSGRSPGPTARWRS